MLQEEDGSRRLRHEHEQIIARLIQRHGWRLLDCDTWIDRALTLVEAGVSPDFASAAKFVYSSVLYWACRDVANEQQRNAAYTELSHYLYDFAYSHDRVNAEDHTQHALEKILACIEACACPGTFLIFALFKLRDAHKATFRQQAPAHPADGPNEDLPPRRLIQTEDRLLRQSGGEHLEETIADSEDSSPLAQVLHKEQRWRLQQYRQEFVQKHPGAARQVDSLCYKYLYDLDDGTIGLLLGATIKHVYVLRFRAKKHLQADPGWRELAQDFGFQLENPA
jgi:DNA-directed RNA polymerase specialized sigma24 family protein